MLEDTLRMAHGMFEGEHGSRGSLDGSHLHAGRLINSPQSLSRPRVPIMIGGGGELKTLRMVAQYGDATNVFGDGPRIAHKYRVLREHCDRLGRDYDEIERTTMQDIDLQMEAGGRGSPPSRIVERFGELADAGAQHIIVTVRDLADPARLERIGRDVLPHLRSL